MLDKKLLADAHAALEFQIELNKKFAQDIKDLEDTVELLNSQLKAANDFREETSIV